MKRWVVPAVVALGIGIWLAWPAPPPSGASPQASPSSVPSPERAAAAVSTERAAPVDAGAALEPLPWLTGEVVDDDGAVAQADLDVRIRSTADEKDCQPGGSTRSVAGGSFELG